MSCVREWIELSSGGVQNLAVVMMVVYIIFGSLRFLVRSLIQVPDPYRGYKKLLGRALLLSLEFLIAADVICTILLDETAESVAVIGGLVVVRTFLTVVVEIDGHWPPTVAAATLRDISELSPLLPSAAVATVRGRACNTRNICKCC